MSTTESRFTPASSRHVLGELGALLLDAGLSVTDVRAALEGVGEPAARVAFSVLPADVIVSDARTGDTTVVRSREKDLSLVQAAHASRLHRHVAAQRIPLSEVPARIARIRAEASSGVAPLSVAGSALVSAGLAILFRCPWWAVLTALVVGVLVGVMTTFLSRLSGARAVVPFFAAFVSTAIVGVLSGYLHLGAVPLFAVCAPIAIMVPGSVITNALLELTSIDIVTGTARLVYGLIVLGFMAAGIAAGTAVTGLTIDGDSAFQVGQTRNVAELGSGWYALAPLWFAWVGVVLLAVGVGLAFGANIRLTGMIVVTMLVTYALVLLLSPVLGDITATGVAAVVVFLASRIFETTTGLIPATAVFQPAFLLLVPGTVGLVAFVSQESAAIFVALATFVSLCIGTKAGAIIADTARGIATRRRAATP